MLPGKHNFMQKNMLCSFFTQFKEKALEKFPIVDIEKYFNSNKIEKDNYSQEIDTICRNSGFLAIKNHGIDQSVIDGIWNATERFFSLSSNKKNESKAPFDGYPYGQLGPGKEALAASKGMNTPPDLKESFNGGPILRPCLLNTSDAADATLQV